MITSRAVFALHYSITGVSSRRHAATRDYAEALDSTPTHSWMTWRYHYPQRSFPYADLERVSQKMMVGRSIIAGWSGLV